MRARNDLIFNFILSTIWALVIAGFQTSFWTRLTPFDTAPNLWLFMYAYICLYRPFVYGVTFAYLNSYLLLGFTHMPFGVLLAFHICVLAILSFVRKRIFWPTIAYFVATCASISLGGTLIFHFLSWMSERHATQTVAWQELAFSILLAPLFGPAILMMGQMIDKIYPVPNTGANEV